MLEVLRPTYIVRAAGDINPGLVMAEQSNVRAITWDLDKTLVGQHSYELTESHLAVLRAFSELKLTQGIISNAQSAERTERVRELAARIGNYIGGEFFAITSRMVGGKRKPNPVIFEEAAREVGLKTYNLCHVGDQIFKDILGANRAKYGATVLVAPYGEGDDWRVRYLQRPVEAAVRPMLGMPAFTATFPTELEAL